MASSSLLTTIRTVGGIASSQSTYGCTLRLRAGGVSSSRTSPSVVLGVNGPPFGSPSQQQHCRTVWTPSLGMGARRPELGLRYAESPSAPSRYGQSEEPQDGEENVRRGSNLPHFFKELSKDPGDPPNLWLWACGFVVVVLMRDTIFRELAHWVIWAGRLALYAADALTLGLAALTNVAAEPIAVVLTLVGSAAVAVTDLYHFILDTTPVLALVKALVLSSAVLSIGDASASTVRGSESPLVGVATLLGVAGVLEVLSPIGLLLSLALLTAYAFLIQKADLVSGLMPATVTIVAVSEPVLQVLAFLLFVIVSIYANWKLTPQQEENKVTPKRRRAPVILLAAAFAVAITLAARVLHARSVAWLLVR